MTPLNAVIHECCFVREESRSAKFPEVDRKKYLDLIAAEVAICQHPQLKREMELLIKRHRRDLPPIKDKPLSVKILELAQTGRRLSPRSLVPIERPRPFWNFLENRFGVESRGLDYKVSEFETEEAAVAYAEQHSRAKNWGASLVEIGLRAKAVAQIDEKKIADCDQC